MTMWAWSSPRAPPEARAPMERRLLRDPVIRSANGEFRSRRYTGARPALQGLTGPTSKRRLWQG
eukprot:9959423-Alexandrium_andersonii.AAC.1